MYISSWSVLKTLTYIREGNKSFVRKSIICRKREAFSKEQPLFFDKNNISA